MSLSHADQIRSLKAKKRIVNLLGLALGLGIFLVIAVIVAQKQVGNFEKVTHTDQNYLMVEGRGQRRQHSHGWRDLHESG